MLYHVSILHSLLWLKNTPFYGYTTFHYPFISCWTFELFHFLAIMNNAVVNICVQIFVRIYVFISLGIYLIV